MSEDTGRTVTCHRWAPKSEAAPHQVTREVCLRKPDEVCQTCPHSRFLVRIQVGIGNQAVACPRWKSETDWRLGDSPESYVIARRELCLTQKPFDFCVECPNSRAKNPPTQEPGWVSAMLRDLRAKRLVLYEKGRLEE